MKCRICNGKGSILKKYDVYGDEDIELGLGNYFDICHHCKGKKETDWLEDIFGVSSESVAETWWYGPDISSIPNKPTSAPKPPKRIKQ